jgi:hypothetical protein
MMALPGSTYATFTRDLQWACDKNLTAYVSWTTLLPNTPMAGAEYMAEHAIRTVRDSRFRDPAFVASAAMPPPPPDTVVATRTFDEQTFVDMARLSGLFHLFYGESILKYVLAFLRWRHGIRDVDVLELLRDDGLAAYPLLQRLRDWKQSFAGGDVLRECVTGNLWPAVYDEFEAFVERELAVRADNELREVCAAQRFVMAYAGRRVPDVLAMKYDVPRWFQDCVAGGEVHQLRTYGRASLVVRDDNGACGASAPRGYAPHSGCFELASAFTAPLTAMTQGTRSVAEDLDIARRKWSD